MKKSVRRLGAMVLTLVLVFSLCSQAFAAWPATGDTSVDNYLLLPGTLYSSGTPISSSSYTLAGFVNVYLVDGSNFVFTPTSIDFGSLNGQKGNTASLTMGQAYDFSKPVQYNVTASDGRTFPVFAMAAEATGGWSGWTEHDSADLLAMSELIANTFVDIAATMGQINRTELEIGSYHPANAEMLNTLGYWLGMRTAYYTDENSGMNGNRLFDSYMNIWNTGGAEAVEFVQNYLEAALEQKSTTGGSYMMKPAALKIIYEQIVPFYLNYALTPISEPMIKKVTIGGSVGTIDAASRTVTVLLPEDTDLNTLEDPVIEVEGWNKAVKIAGSVASKTLAYQITPYDLAYGTAYNGLSATWSILIDSGTPDNSVRSFAVTVGDETRYAKIDEEAKTIKLNLPEGTDLTAISPAIEHTGTGTNMDSGTFDFSNSKSTPLTLTVTNRNFDLETKYAVTITAEKSAENYITSYKIGDAVGSIEDGSIAITIPYATDLTTAVPDITISEFATLTQSPDELIVGDNTYIVTAENGEAKTWIVKITREAVATGNSILSFGYGSVHGTIDQALGTISLELPAGTSTTFAPTIKVSPYATISPASGNAQDFSSHVIYTVTAQNGATNSYTVTVTVSTEAVENPYVDDMRALVNKIITRYRSSAADDWEYMNLGFYAKSLNNMSSATIAERIAKLEVDTNVAMTNIDRKIMTLTANGIDCTNLAQYNNGEPYTDKNGNEVDNLVEILYNYSGGYTINGPTFALIALDMGNYTVPSNAKWTRAVLLETLLNHTYLSDGFGLDMVTMMMQAMAPYYNDPTYGARVQAKLNEGFEIVQQYFGDDNIWENPFGVQWGGVYTSEGSAQVLCALAAMGIDAHSDIRLNDGTHSALTALLDYANYEDGYFHHSASVLDNAMATYQGCYATQWYLGFLENGGAGHPYSLYANRFDFSKDLSGDASITKFVLEGKQGVITEGGEDGQNTIEVTLPTGTSLTSMYPHVTVTAGATLIAPDLDQSVTFIEGVAQPFTVQAEDGETQKTYYVTVTLSDDVEASGTEIVTATLELQDANILRDLEILDTIVTTGEDGATQIELMVNAGVDTKNLYLKARLSANATCDPDALDGETKLDLTDWKTFTITSQDGENTSVYRIKVTPKQQASITAFKLTINGTDYSGTIDNSKNTITISGVDDSNLSTTTFAPDITLGEGTTVCSPTSGVAQDFSKTVSYIVSGTQVVSRTYTVSVYNASGSLISSTGSGGETTVPESTTAKITGFSIYGVDAEIDQELGTIVITLPNGTDVTAVSPEITTTSGCAVSPADGEVVNLTRPIIYTVTLGEDSRTYTVSVIYQRTVSQQLWDEVSEGGNNTISDHQVSYDPHGLPGGWGSNGGGW